MDDVEEARATVEVSKGLDTPRFPMENILLRFKT